MLFRSIQPATLFGKGTVDRLGGLIAGDAPAGGAGGGKRRNEGGFFVAVVDWTLSPVQQRNLERAWNCKVIDRTGLILEIFGARARTREGRPQVVLAAPTYQRSRLLRSWPHLERQRGGAGFMGGPGERQIETDRRLIDRRITRLKRQLADVTRTRHLHRKARRRVPYPVIALVGYTNAGKSTLFNALTRAEVTVRDQLFATLDPTMRGLGLPSGRTVIMSDTVGFISGLPHELVNAFHATLEEVLEADLIVHVRDAAHAGTRAQKQDVLKVLGELGIDDAGALIEVFNKIDLLSAKDRKALVNRVKRSNAPRVALSALSGEGCPSLLAVIDEKIAGEMLDKELTLAPDDGAALAWLYGHGEVVERLDGDDAIRLKVRLDAANWARFSRRNG